MVRQRTVYEVQSSTMVQVRLIMLPTRLPTTGATIHSKWRQLVRGTVSLLLSLQHLHCQHSKVIWKHSCLLMLKLHLSDFVGTFRFWC